MAVPRAPEVGGAATRWFGSLGRFLVRHPWYPIVFWIVLLVVAVPFLSRVGSVTTNSATNLPSSAPSSIASAQIASEFPNATAPTDSVLLVVGPNVTGPTGQSLVVRLTAAISDDKNLSDVAGVSTLYGAYTEYVEGQGELGLGALRAYLPGPTGLLVSIRAAVTALWTPPILFVDQWLAYGANHSSERASQWNAPAYNATLRVIGSNSSAVAVLEAFYGGWPPGDAGGFNGSADCAANISSVDACATAVERANELDILPRTNLSAAASSLAPAVLDELSIGNATNGSAQRQLALSLVAAHAGLPMGFTEALAGEFPTYAPPAIAVLQWALNVSTGPSSSYPFPIPPAIQGRFVASDGAAEILLVSYSVDSGYVDAQGHDPVYADVAEIGRIAPSMASEAGFAFYQTGGAPLDDYENTVLSSSLAIVLPLTVIVLIAITMLYFRTPLAPLLTFGGLGIALGLGIGSVVLIGTFVTHVDVTAIELEETFVLGVGTDYSIFLVARFREELQRGADPNEAVVTSVTWTGQSVATSGATAILATSALAFSGVALLSQWGIVLSVAILVTVLISLTLIPACLTLFGRRVFWPSSGARFDREAAAHRARFDAERTYFFRAGRFAQRRPRSILLVLIAVSIPLLYVAVNVPLNYDFYGQLPGGSSSTNGLGQLGAHFGGGDAFPIETLVRFSAPLLVGNGTNATEFGALANLTSRFANTSGVYSVGSPIGPSGAPLVSWLELSTLSPSLQLGLHSILAGYLGQDGRTILLTIVPTSSGLSYTAVQLLGTLAGEFQSFRAAHPSAQQIYFGGGAPTTNDIAQQTSAATDRMILVVSIGLIIVLFAVLRSWIIPLLAVATIGLSIGWSWATTGLVLQQGLGVPLFYFVPTVLFIIILGLGIDYNIFLLTRVREERLHGRTASEAAVQAVAATGGIITAAAVILGSAFAVLASGQFVLLRAIGFAVATAVLLDAMVVRTYLVPAALHTLGERVWRPISSGRPGSSKPP
ncbi:MAG TPA: MMPL family transporter [Thermoplasmata archaeon]|nr:MMPL family transporter [Thermoplasmata archaeon]